MAIVRLPRDLLKNSLFLYLLPLRWREPHFRLGSPPIIWLHFLFPLPMSGDPRSLRCEHLRDPHSLLTVTFWLLDNVSSTGGGYYSHLLVSASHHVTVVFFLCCFFFHYVLTKFHLWPSLELQNWSLTTWRILNNTQDAIFYVSSAYSKSRKKSGIFFLFVFCFLKQLLSKKFWTRKFLRWVKLRQIIRRIICIFLAILSIYLPTTFSCTLSL